MSTQLLFPNIRPLDDPPPRENTLHHGRRTPCYALAWRCPAPKYIALIKQADPSLTARNVREHAVLRWIRTYGLPNAQQPMIRHGYDGRYYIIAMLNARAFPDYATRALRDPLDPLVVAAKDVFYVADDLQPSFMWYRLPLHWTAADADLLDSESELEE